MSNIFREGFMLFGRSASVTCKCETTNQVMSYRPQQIPDYYLSLGLFNWYRVRAPWFEIFGILLQFRRARKGDGGNQINTYRYNNLFPRFFFFLGHTASSNSSEVKREGPNPTVWIHGPGWPKPDSWSRPCLWYFGPENFVVQFVLRDSFAMSLPLGSVTVWLCGKRSSTTEYFASHID